jgi:hypothetical protein
VDDPKHWILIQDFSIAQNFGLLSKGLVQRTLIAKLWAFQEDEIYSVTMRISFYVSWATNDASRSATLQYFTHMPSSHLLKISFPAHFSGRIGIVRNSQQ